MSFDKLHKWWNRQSAIVVVYVVVMLLPNVLLAITEPYSFMTVTASLLMPGAVYLLLAVALKRPGLLMLCSFPLMVLGASAHSMTERIIGSAALFVASALITLMLLMANHVQRILGKTGLAVLSKLTGLLLAAIAAQVVFTGVKNFLIVG